MNSIHEKKSAPEVNENWMLTIFALLAVVISLQPLLSGDQGYFRVMDTTDMYFDKVRYLVNFWQDSEGYSWNPSPLRGWPSHAGSIGPQHLLVLLATVFQEVYAFVLFQVAIDFFTMAGMYLFAKRITAANSAISVVAALMFCSSFYWYDENIVVTAALLLPLLIVLTSHNSHWPTINPIFRLLSIFFIFTSSFPPYTLPLLPMAQLVVLVIFKKAIDWRKTTFFFAIFWISYLLFHAQSIQEILFSVSDSNRSLWVRMDDKMYSDLKNIVVRYFQNDTFVYPAFIALLFMNKVNFKKVLAAFATALLLLILSSFQSSILYVLLKDQYPAFSLLNATIHRAFNFVPVALVVGAVLALKESLSNQFKLKYLLGVYALFVIFIIFTFTPDVNRSFAYMVIGLIFLIIFKVQFIYQKGFTPLVILIMGLVVLIPSKLKQRIHTQSPQMGYLYIDKFHYPSDDPYRVVTLMPKHYSLFFYPAQASIKGIETFDGFSVFYDRNDAQYWQIYIDEITNALYQKHGQSFANWNNRIEFTIDEFKTDPDYFIDIFQFNNVKFLRSLEVISHPELELVETSSINILDRMQLREYVNPFHSANYQKHKDYLYEIKNSLPRIFTIANDYTIEDFSVDKLPQLGESVKIKSYRPGYITFSANTRPGEKIIISTNYSEDWSLSVNGQTDSSRISEDVFGLISIAPILGLNTYTIKFKDNYWLIIFQMLIGFFTAGIFLTSKYYQKMFKL